MRTFLISLLTSIAVQMILWVPFIIVDHRGNYPDAALFVGIIAEIIVLILYLVFVKTLVSKFKVDMVGYNVCNAILMMVLSFVVEFLCHQMLFVDRVCWMMCGIEYLMMATLCTLAPLVALV